MSAEEVEVGTSYEGGTLASQIARALSPTDRAGRVSPTATFAPTATAAAAVAVAAAAVAVATAPGAKSANRQKFNPDNDCVRQLRAGSGGGAEGARVVVCVHSPCVADGFDNLNLVGKERVHIARADL